MKRIESVKLSGLNGERVDVVTFARWKKQIAGIEFGFALHLLPSFKVGLPNRLWISEIGTGFNTLVVVKHPVSGQHMTDVMADKLGQSYVVRLAKSALHNQLKVCGDGAFVDGLVRAEMLLAKQQRQREVAAEPKCEACEDTGVTATLGEGGELKAVECQVCMDSKVVATTDYDHEGQPIEARCPECVEQSGGLTKPAFANIRMEHVQFPTEEEWYESLSVKAKLDYLEAQITGLSEDSKQLSARATKADYDRIDDMDAQVSNLQQQRRELLWERRTYLQERTDQHSTMTGDTTEQEYETLTEELADIDKQIHDLENPPCSK